MIFQKQIISIQMEPDKLFSQKMILMVHYYYYSNYYTRMAASLDQYSHPCLQHKTTCFSLGDPKVKYQDVSNHQNYVSCWIASHPIIPHHYPTRHCHSNLDKIHQDHRYYFHFHLRNILLQCEHGNLR